MIGFRCVNPLARALLTAGLAGAAPLVAAPHVTRLTPPSGLFSYGDPAPPHISRFLPGQRFDLQATVRPDADRAITGAEFLVDNVPVPGAVALTPATVDGSAAGTLVATRRAFSASAPGVHTLTVRAKQDDGATVVAQGSFEVVALTLETGAKPRNIVVMIGDGMGIAHRTAARLMLHGSSQGKALAPLAMDTFPATALVQTASLNSIVTDSAPGAAAYSTGNKNHNDQEAVFPDDTNDSFDNPRIESIGEYLARTQGKWLGIVTTADVTDATPAAFGVHTQNRRAGTGIADQFLDETVARANLHVLLGGGRAWFLSNALPGSARNAETDYTLPEELAAGWGLKRGAIDPVRNLLGDFRTAGFTYVATGAQLKAVPAATDRLLGLFQLGNMNAALDKIGQRRGRSTVVEDFGFPDQPMLDEMTDTALGVLKQSTAGFVLMVEGGSIDKQAHNMDTARWLHEVIEFDRAVARVKAFAQAVPDTLVIVTADHETGGVNVIGASTVSQEELARRATASDTGPLRDIVGVYSAAGFPNYKVLADGYPDTANVDRRMLVGYAANGDRYEDWEMNPKPIGGPAGYPTSTVDRGITGGFFITGQIPGTGSVHTGSDVPLSAFGAGAAVFSGVLDNTDVFFKTMQLVLGGAPVPAASAPATPAMLSAAVGQRTAAERLINLSSRGLVGSGEAAMFNGFVLAGAQSHRLLIRGVGPTLADYGIAAPLADPVLRLRNAAHETIATNDDWEANDNILAVRAAGDAVGAFVLPPGSKDAVLLVTLPPGSYTAELSGKDGAQGVALLEVYELP